MATTRAPPILRQPSQGRRRRRRGEQGCQRHSDQRHGLARARTGRTSPATAAFKTSSHRRSI